MSTDQLQLVYRPNGCFSSSIVDLTANGTFSANTFTDCLSTCLSNKFSIALSQQECFCIPLFSTSNSSWFPVNPVECNESCPDSTQQCGGRERFNIYSINSTTVIQPDTQIDNGTDNVAIIPNPSANTLPVYQEPWFIGLMVAIAFLILIAAAVASSIYFKKKRITTLPRYPRTADSSQSSADYLINGFLPRTPTMTYMAAHPYLLKNSSPSDEIEVRTNNILHVQAHYKDLWGRGVNVTTGQRGAFPLSCLVADDSYSSKAPKRTDSLKPTQEQGEQENEAEP